MRVWMEAPNNGNTFQLCYNSFSLSSYANAHQKIAEVADKFEINFLPVETMGHGEATLEFGYPFTSNRDWVVITFLFLVVGFSLFREDTERQVASVRYEPSMMTDPT